MEIIELKHDIVLLTVRAASFPHGIQDAFSDLKRHLPAGDERTPYGISKPEKDGTIVYRAGVEATTDAEARERSLETVILKKGKYRSVTVTDWQTKIDTLSGIFDTLLQDPHLDPASPCIEIYKSRTEMVCLVRIK